MTKPLIMHMARYRNDLSTHSCKNKTNSLVDCFVIVLQNQKIIKIFHIPVIKYTFHLEEIIFNAVVVVDLA